MIVSVVSSQILQSPYRTSEDRACEVLYLLLNAGVVNLSVESEGKQTGSFSVNGITGVCPADLSSDLRDFTIASGTGRMWLSRW